MPKAAVELLGRWGQLGQEDTVVLEGQRFGVRGWIAYDDEWIEYLLEDGRWLCVEDDGGLRFSVWEDVGPSAYELDQSDFGRNGVEYTRTEQYKARWLAAGIAGLTGPGLVNVSEYVGDDGGLLALEDWGDGSELALGRYLAGDDVDL